MFPHRSSRLRFLGFSVRLATCLLFALAATPAGAEDPKPKFLDLSLLVAEDHPCTWPAGFPPFQINHYLKIGPLSAYNSDVLMFDENTGTQFDAPTHSVASPDSGKPNAGRFGTVSGDKVPPWQFAGEACVIDCRQLLGSAPNGRSDLVTKAHVIGWEKRYRPLTTGDVVLFRSDYTDRYFRPFPEGRLFLADPLEGKSLAWPDPDPGCMEYLASRQVMSLGTDSPSMGPIPGPIGEETHFAGLKHGMIWTEGATGLGGLPTTGAFYCILAPKVVSGIGGAGRAFAVVGEPLAGRLIASARKKNVIDLSVPYADDTPVWWPGAGVGRSRYPYLKDAMPPHRQNRHTMDSHAGTHLVPPAYALPTEGFDDARYAPEVRAWLAEYEKQYGRRGTSDVTTEKVPVEQTCGRARVIDVRHLLGTTARESWPASPEITPAAIAKYESHHGELKPGDVVVFRSGWSDKHLKPFPQGNSCMADPLNGKSEGWPAPGPEAVLYLAKKGVRCVATDGPTLGGAEPKRALITYWALGGSGVAGVEYLTNLERLPEGAYFLFAALKVRGCHGGPGRALALY
jgi:kynurenine formamidase